MKTTRIIILLSACLALGTIWVSCRPGSSNGVRVLGEVRESGEPVFLLPGENRMLLVFTRWIPSEDIQLTSVTYGGVPLEQTPLLRPVDQSAGLLSVGGWLKLWCLNESGMSGTDSSDLEFGFSGEKGTESGLVVQTSAVLLEGVHQARPFCGVAPIFGPQSGELLEPVEVCSGGSVLMVAVEQDGGQGFTVSGFTQVNDPGRQDSSDQIELFARFLSADKPDPIEIKSHEGLDNFSAYSIGISPVR